MRIGVLDGPDICNILQYGLTIAGHTVRTFITAESFFASLAHEAKASFCCFDLIIVDAFFLTEEYSGVQILHEVRKRYPNLPIVLFLFTPSEIQGIAKEDLSNVQIIQKPFTFSLLFAAIKGVELLE